MRSPPPAAAAFVLAACLPAQTPAPRSEPQATSWIGTWAASPQPPFKGEAESYEDQSLRLIVHTSAGGTRVRVRFANVFGDEDLLIGAAHVARRTAGADVDPRSDRALRFGGRPSVEVPRGASVSSDPVDLDVPALSDLAVSLFLPRATRATTTHVMALQTSYVSARTGDATAAAVFPVASKTKAWPFLAGVDVAAPPGAFAVVAFGDSQVDGDGSTEDANRRWPDVLAARLHAEGGAGVGVLNEGIIGNRLLRDSPLESPVGAAFGPSALARFDRDALGQPGVKVVILRLGTNDIGLPGSFAPPAEGASAEAIIAGFRQLAARAKQRGLRVIGTTLSPFEGTTIAAGYHTPEKEGVRLQVNAWIRAGAGLDAVVDFDAVLRDPAHPSRILPAFDSGDHLHPNDAGYAALAEAVPSGLLRGSGPGR